MTTRAIFKTRGWFYYRRKATSGIMLGLTGVATLLAILPLAWILLYVLQQGGRFLSLDFFTQLPTPVGVPGGGIANAIGGSLLVVGIACLIAIPISIVAAFYTAENPNTPLGIAVRFGTDVLAGVPSIVMGIFAYTVVVLTQRHFSALSGGFALAIIMIPIVRRPALEDDAAGTLPRRHQRCHYRRDARDCPRRRRSGADDFHGLWQSLFQFRSQPTDRHAAAYDFRLRDFSLQRLARQGMDDRARPHRTRAGLECDCPRLFVVAPQEHGSVTAERQV
jgi:hypothetical protein